jgi:hypothetical protein
MRPGNCGNLGDFGNVVSVSYRPHYPGDETNPPSPLSYFLIVVTENFVGLVIVKLRISGISLVRVFCILMMRSTGIWPAMVTAREDLILRNETQ